MKKIVNIINIFVLSLLMFASCDEDKMVTLGPDVRTLPVTTVTDSTAIGFGFIVANGGNEFTERGFVYSSTNKLPTVNDSKLLVSTKEARFTSKLSKLAFTTKYYYRAYGINSVGTFYGDTASFMTSVKIPVVSTKAITDITGNTAMSGGEVTIGGGANITERGICYGTTANPTTANTKVVNGTGGTGAFISSLVGLYGNTKYYVRAYATNAAGTGYGTEVSFTTAKALPIVVTGDITDITKISAKAAGSITHNGGDAITKRGFVWSTSPAPDLSGSKTEAALEGSTFSSALPNLTVDTKYYIRAYAINGTGTAYGEEKTFNTKPNIYELYVAGAYQGWSPSTAPMLKGTEDNVQGYVYMATAGNFKITSQRNWDGPNYGIGSSAGTISATGGDIPMAEAGFYWFKVNLATMTYTALKMDWGVIGDATPNVWNDETALQIDPATNTWSIYLPLTAGKFKFRANHSWDYNFGDTGVDFSLEAGGDDIALPGAGTYEVVLDFNTPGAPTYVYGYWGIIGSSTADGWGSDQNMTYDATNKVWTITTDLKVGEFKFRANDDWKIDFGGGSGVLTRGGSNIPVAVAGNYTITLNTKAKTYTLVKN
jgi:starch-binding outer membrane protein SusE/F